MSGGGDLRDAVPVGEPPGDDISGGRRSDYRLADQLSDLSRKLERHDDVDDTLGAIVHAAVGTVPGAQHASITSTKARREVHTRASTDDLAGAVDQAQYDAGQGPCLDALFEQETVRVSDLATDDRWPDFAGRARDLGVGGMLAVRLFVQGDDLGALNLYTANGNVFDDDSEHVALLFAAHAAVAMSGAQKQESMHKAMTTRDVIGQAKGILMERFKITHEQAFLLLVQASQSSNRKLHEVAAELASSGELVER